MLLPEPVVASGLLWRGAVSPQLPAGSAGRCGATSSGMERMCDSGAGGMEIWERGMLVLNAADVGCADVRGDAGQDRGTNAAAAAFKSVATARSGLSPDSRCGVLGSRGMSYADIECRTARS